MALTRGRLSNVTAIAAAGNADVVTVANNKKVSKGETLFILEAMKMQHEIKANIDGLTSNIRVKENSQVSTGDLLVKISLKP